MWFAALFLIFLLIFYTVFFPIAFLFTIFLIGYLVRLYFKDPQVPFIVKIMNHHMMLDNLIKGAYTGKFNLFRFNLARKVDKILGAGPPPVPDPKDCYIENLEVPSLIDDHKIPISVFIPDSAKNQGKKLPILFYLSPGAFHRVLPMRNKEEYLEMGFMIVTVRYRLAPENKFPKAVEDVFSSLSYIAKKSTALFENHWDSRLVLLGHSAGGGLAAASALMVRDRGLPLNIICQILAAPALFWREPCPSHTQYKNWYIHGEKVVLYIDDMLINDKKDYENPYLCPLKAKDLSKLPPAYFILSERDYFCSESDIYFEKLKSCGNKAVCKHYPAEHGFFGTPSLVAKKAREEMKEYLKELMEETKKEIK